MKSCHLFLALLLLASFASSALAEETYEDINDLPVVDMGTKVIDGHSSRDTGSTLVLVTGFRTSRESAALTVEAFPLYARMIRDAGGSSAVINKGLERHGREWESPGECSRLERTNLRPDLAEIDDLRGNVTPTEERERRLCLEISRGGQKLVVLFAGGTLSMFAMDNLAGYPSTRHHSLQPTLDFGAALENGLCRSDGSEFCPYLESLVEQMRQLVEREPTVDLDTVISSSRQQASSTHRTARDSDLEE